MSKDVLVVIGAGSIGQAIARRTGPGRKILLADFNETTLKTAADALEDAGHAVTTRRVDVSDRSMAGHMPPPLDPERAHALRTPRPTTCWGCRSSARTRCPAPAPPTRSPSRPTTCASRPPPSPGEAATRRTGSRRTYPEGIDDDAARASTRIATARADATTRSAALAAQIAALAEQQALTTHDDEHDPEGVTIGFERAQILGLLAGARKELAALDRAESRLRAGTYGRCLTCGREIPDARLEALPGAETCVECAG